MTCLICDGSFEGFLSAIFELYERRLSNHVRIRRLDDQAIDLFATRIDVCSDSSRASRVWAGIEKIGGRNAALDIWKVWVSEVPDNEDILCACIQYMFRVKGNIFKDLSHPDVLKFGQALKIIGRERHRMEAFVRFEQSVDGLYYSAIEPDFNVLPLLVNHFRDRYADQRWLIYDTKRKYGVYYDLHTLETVEIQLFAKNTSSGMNAESEEKYQDLWATYFGSTNIRERKNLRLHLRHVPKRYWRFLTEKTRV